MARKKRSTDPLIEQRIHSIVPLRLESAGTLDIMSFVSERETRSEYPWVMPEDGKHLSYRQISRYVSRADKFIKLELKTHPGNNIHLHVAKLDRMHALAIKNGDIKTALEIMKEKAELLGMYPEKKKKYELSGPGGKAMAMDVKMEAKVIDARKKILSFVDEIREAATRNLQEKQSAEVNENTNGDGHIASGTNGQ